MQEKAKIFKLLVNELRAYPNPQITPEGLGLIAERLDKRYTYEQVERAMGRLTYKAKFFPSLAEIADEIGSKNLTAEGYRVKWVN
jgi:hypothetical protein